MSSAPKPFVIGVRSYPTVRGWATIGGRAVPTDYYAYPNDSDVNYIATVEDGLVRLRWCSICDGCGCSACHKTGFIEGYHWESKLEPTMLSDILDSITDTWYRARLRGLLQARYGTDDMEKIGSLRDYWLIAEKRT